MSFFIFGLADSVGTFAGGSTFFGRFAGFGEGDRGGLLDSRAVALRLREGGAARGVRRGVGCEAGGSVGLDIDGSIGFLADARVTLDDMGVFRRRDRG